MGQADYKENRYHKAIENYELGLEKAEEINYAFMMQQISYSLSWVYEQIDNHKLALSYYKEYFTIKEKIFDEKSDKLLSEIKTLYEIDNLRKEKQKQDQDIARLENIRNIVIIVLVIIILAVVIYFLILQKKIERLKNEKLKAEIDFLRNQINPHFLFNTLNNINTLTQIDPPKASQSILMLSDMMRYQLYDCSKGKIRLKDEIAYLKNLLKLENLRKPKAKLNFDILSDIPYLELRPFMFLPYVENAIKHGLFNSPNSLIHIELDIDDKHLYFKIKNSKQEEQDKKIGGFGLNNAKHRLELLYPKNHQLDIKDEPNFYQVNLRLNINN